MKTNSVVPQFSAHSGQRRKTRNSRRHGQVLVEMALSITLLLAIVMGIMEFGFLARNNLLLANASREGARVASLGRTDSATQTRIISSMKPLTTTFGTASGNSQLQYSTNDGTTWATWPANSGGYNGVPVGSLIRVTVTTRHTPLTGFFAFLKNRDISQYTTMKREANG